MLNKYDLKIELVNDPEEIGYSSMSDAEAAIALNTVNRQINRKFVSGQEIYEAINEAEFQAIPNNTYDPPELATTGQQTIRDIYTLGDRIPIQAGRAKSNILALFPNGTTTRTNLIALAKTTVSRAQELGWRPVTEGDVAQARALS